MRKKTAAEAAPTRGKRSKSEQTLERPGPVGGKRDENRKQRRAEFESAALYLFLKQGIEGTTIDDIVDRTGAAKGSFYRYYEDKRDIVDALLEPVRSALLAAFDRAAQNVAKAKDPGELMEAYQAMALETAGTVLEHQRLVLLYLQESRAPGVGAREPVRALYELVAKAALDLTHAAHQHKLLRPLDPAVTSVAVLGAVEQLLFEFFRAPEQGEPLKAAEALISMVMDGLKPR